MPEPIKARFLILMASNVTRRGLQILFGTQITIRRGFSWRNYRQSRGNASRNAAPVFPLSEKSRK